MELTSTGTMQMTNTTPSQTGVATERRYRILAIDDDEVFRNLLKANLTEYGFEVEAVGNPVKALEAFTRDKDRFDLVILDYYMPHLDGAKTFEWLRKMNPNIKVIICSGADEMRLRQIQAQHPIDGYIHKPFRIAEALFVIRRLLNQPVAR